MLWLWPLTGGHAQGDRIIWLTTPHNFTQNYSYKWQRHVMFSYHESIYTLFSTNIRQLSIFLSTTWAPDPPKFVAFSIFLLRRTVWESSCPAVGTHRITSSTKGSMVWFVQWVQMIYNRLDLSQHNIFITSRYKEFNKPNRCGLRSKEHKYVWYVMPPQISHKT